LRTQAMIALLTVGCGAVQAAQPALDAARRCVAVQDSLTRLVCFDKAMQGDVTSAAPVAAPVAESIPRAAATLPPTVVSAPALGDELVKKSRQSEEAAAPSNLTATVICTGSRWTTVRCGNKPNPCRHFRSKSGTPSGSIRVAWAAIVWRGRARGLVPGSASPACANLLLTFVIRIG
jgi:hypothetical protein